MADEKNNPQDSTGKQGQSEVKAPKDNAAAELARVHKREQMIRQKIAQSGGVLSREQAEASVANQEKFDATKAEVDEQRKKGAKK